MLVRSHYARRLPLDPRHLRKSGRGWPGALGGLQAGRGFGCVRGAAACRDTGGAEKENLSGGFGHAGNPDVFQIPEQSEMDSRPVGQAQADPGRTREGTR
ncbi:hypothetical protein DESC_480238 [Desulfosarcina cetonica]|nr:hypothetical protein DESC_480238 [Desulfosarcina cetonica]